LQPYSIFFLSPITQITFNTHRFLDNLFTFLAMQKIILSLALGLLFIGAPSALLAQEPETVDILTEASDPDEFGGVTPLDDITEKTIMDERRVLPYQHIREADIFWEKVVWRVLDVREKMNLPFVYPEDPFFKILANAAKDGDMEVYSVEDDKFLNPISTEDVLGMMASVDTTVTFDPETYEEIIQVVANEINWEDVKRFRIKEKWFFDKNTSTLQVRILGIAPLIDVKDDQGNFRFEKPMFWVYYPDAREMLARHRVFNLGGNTNSTLSWEDYLEMRYFSSYIYKESNVFDRKLESYLSGVDLLMESEKINNEIFNFEHDLWSY